FVEQVYGVNGLVLAEDHILYSVGKFSTQLKNYGAALSAYTQLIDTRSRLNAPSKQVAHQQVAYFREFLTLYKLVENNLNKSFSLQAVTGNVDLPESVNDLMPDLPELPVPWICAQESVLLMDSSSASNPPSSEPSACFASGISFTNYVEEHSEKWKGLERITVEKTHGAVFRQPLPQLLTQRSDNTRSPVLCIDEPCWLLLPITNPLLVSFALRELKLLYKFVPEDHKLSSLDSEKIVLQSSSVDYVVLAPGETHNLIFKVQCSRLGRILIEGLHYKLSLAPEDGNDATSSLPVITGKQAFSVKGPRLNNNLKNRSSVTYAADRRLEITVVPPMPKVRVQFKGLPERLLCGQLVRADISIENVSDLPITGLYVASADPQHAYSVFDRSQPGSISDPSSSTSSWENSVPGDLKKESSACPYVQKIVSNSNSSEVLPKKGNVVHGTLWIQGQQSPGLQNLLLLFYCHTPDANGKVGYRMLRHHSSFIVDPSVGLSVHSSSSVSFPLVQSSRPDVSHDDQSKSSFPLDTRPSQETNQVSSVQVRHAEVSNFANIAVEVTAATSSSGSEAVVPKIRISAISCYSAKWRLKPFGSQKPHEVLELWPGESVRTMVQSCSSSKASSLSSESDTSMFFSVIHFGEGNNDPNSLNSYLLDSSWQKSYKSFALRQLTKVPPLTADAPAVCPTADCPSPSLHPALEQYNSLRRSSDLHMVLTVHWVQSHTDISATEPNSSVIRGQHSVVLSRVGSTVVVPVSPSPLLSGEEPQPPVRIIPAEPAELPQIPLDFAKSVGIDLNAEAGSVVKRPSVSLTVAQATSLYEKHEVDVTGDLSVEQLDTCVKVRALCQTCVRHDFSKNKMCPVNFVVLVHNTTDASFTCILELVSQSSATNVQATQSTAHASSSNTSATLRYVGVVTRMLRLLPSSQCQVPCEAVVVSAGAHTLGAVVLQLKTDDGVLLVKRVELDAIVVVAE
ncbi:hypothetical protein FHG87_018902, partial [Trinorchestia longiramus]